MKTQFLNISFLVALFIVATSCSETEIKPNNPQNLSSTEKIASDKVSAGVASQKVLSTAISGTINGVSFSGNLLVNRFVSEGAATIEAGGKLYAVGRITNIVGVGLPVGVQAISTVEVKVPVSYSASASVSTASSPDVQQNLLCSLLQLDLSAIDLALPDLSGLDFQVHLNATELEIRATGLTGLLLGDLLCVVSTLFGGVGDLVAIVSNLNRIIGLVGILPGVI